MICFVSALFFDKVLQPENMAISHYVMQDSICVFDTLFKCMRNKEHASLFVGLQSIVVFIFRVHRTEIDEGSKSPKNYSNRRYEAKAGATKISFNPHFYAFLMYSIYALFMYSCSI
jgi:hypothetical protein